MEQLKTGIIGLSVDYRAYIDFLTDQDHFAVVAVGDPDREKADQVARELDVTGYDDLRLLIVQEKLDALVLLMPSHACQECITLAIRNGLHVFKTGPVGRTVAEASQWISGMNKVKRLFQVEAPWRFNPVFGRARRAIQDGLIGKIFLIRAEGYMNIPDNPGYRGDPVLAGGGVLMDLGYPLIDQIILAIGRPESIFCHHTNFCSKRFLPPLQTEDTAVLTLGFNGGAVAEVICTWMADPSRTRIVFYGTEGIIEVEEAIYRQKDLMGVCLDEYRSELLPENFPLLQLQHFSDCIQGLVNLPVSQAVDHLASISVIELAYLSARTQSPEQMKEYGDLFKI